MTTAGTVAALFRFPVKSMLGEELTQASFGERGVLGDRAYAVVDTSDGRVASGKHPRKWGRLLQLSARFVDEPTGQGVTPPVAVTFPDGSVVRSDGDVDGALSSFLEREVTLVSSGAEGLSLEEVWPRIDGLAPPELVESLSQGRREGDDPVSDVPVGSMAPAGTFFDLTTLHVLTTATLRRLQELEPDADFDVRRYRPNVLVEVAGSSFVENDWVGATVALGATAEARVDLPTMRCVMTTLAQPGLEADRRSLRAVATHNRIPVGGMGTWACAGSYATVTAGGQVAVGDTVTVTGPA